MHALIKTHFSTHNHRLPCTTRNVLAYLPARFPFSHHVLAIVFLVLTGHIKYPATARSWYVLSFPPVCFNLFVVSLFLNIMPQDKVAGSERSSLTSKHNHSTSCSIITPLPLSHSTCHFLGGQCLLFPFSMWSEFLSNRYCIFNVSNTSLLFNFCDKYHNENKFWEG